MLRSDPLVTIGMPAFNSERTIALSIASIIRQRYCNWELLIADDGSADRTIEIARSFDDGRIRVLSDGHHRGISIRRNELIARARGCYLAWVDADDIAYPERLDLQLAFLDNNPDVHLVGGSMVLFKGDGIPFAHWKSRPMHDDIVGPFWASMRLAQPTWMGRISWFHMHGYNESIHSGAEDRELLSRSARQSRFAALPNEVMGYREDRLLLKKNVLRRKDCIQFLVRDEAATGHYFRAAAVALAETAKGVLDVVATTTPFGYVAVPHRSSSLDRALAQRWREVWTATENHARSAVHASGTVIATT